MLRNVIGMPASEDAAVFAKSFLRLMEDVHRIAGTAVQSPLPGSTHLVEAIDDLLAHSSPVLLASLGAVATGSAAPAD
jgi:hypothetical protein